MSTGNRNTLYGDNIAEHAPSFTLDKHIEDGRRFAGEHRWKQIQNEWLADEADAEARWKALRAKVSKA